MTHEKAMEELDNIDLPIETVRQLFEEFKEDGQVVGMVAMNLSRRTSVYDAEVGKSNELIALLRDLSEVDDMGSRWAVAKNHHTPSDILEKLSHDNINLVRALVATNPSTPVSLLNTFFSDEKIVRDGLSGNPNTPEKLLKILAMDVDKMVRMRVAENPSTPTNILKELLDDSDKDVVKAAETKLEKK
ncbi:MAG: hypothetical protein U9Q90_04950 [Campylobacterota bacterium]|nr:hypothetical protein [Campylobacterota bacterium]